MFRIDIKKTLQYLFFCTLGVLFFVHAYRNFSLDKILGGLQRANLKLVVWAVCFHLLNHFLRAYRWGLLIKPAGGASAHSSAFVAEMTGFFSNVFAPRLGEWTRCDTLKKIEGIPMSLSSAGVIIERTIDIIVFIGMVITAFLVNPAQMMTLFSELTKVQRSFFAFEKINVLIVALCSMSFVLLFIGWQYKHVFLKPYKRFCVFAKELLQVLKKIWKVSSYKVWVATFLIWLSYFLVEYISFFAFKETASLGLSTAIYIFIVINLGIAIPIPGNVGSYHLLVCAALVTFGVQEEIALVYATLTHGIQLFNALVVGGIATVFGIVWSREKKAKAATFTAQDEAPS